ncbi:hypothetical protein HZS55_17100 [Halosimplex rubrum]|uniref:Uncharacterized protein n=1 Tax=Halosimplex rubrum TaxID=869889 RepID=A0A7D5P1R7_9EURY|nr:hypothetical protein [Halosimplex rubrum]QLH78903.1 hypothetical protein HZS55_17100 [Halosimplex rubrum]
MLEQLKQKEYTGSNRCLPCTVVNTVIALVVGAVIGRSSKRAGAVAIVVSGVLIYLRGYLVPGTPTLTKEYMPEWALELFGKEPPTTGGIEVDRDEEEAEFELDAEQFLHGVDAIEPCPDADDDCLVDEFGRRWHSEMESLQGREGLKPVVSDRFDLDESEFEIEPHDDARLLIVEGDHVAKWPSEAALIVDLASAGILAERSDRWDDLGTVQRGQVLRGLRIFLDTCPTSDEPVTMGEETVESCCSTRDVVAVTCAESGARLFEQPIAD